MPNRPFPFPVRRASIAAMLFDEDVLAHRDGLHRHCERLLGCPAEAEDALQETLLRAWRARRTALSNPRAWVFRIATNVCFDALSRRVATVPFEDDAARLVAPCAASEVIDREAIELLLDMLPAQQRAVWVLRDVMHWSARDTAALLDTTVPAANSALQRARSALRVRLADDHLARSCERATSNRGL